VALGDFSIRLRSRRKDELGEILTSFNRMADDLEKLRKQLLRSERLAAWQEVARKIAHEIKNPLSPIQISIETLRKVHKRKHPEFKTIFQESTQTILEEVEKIRHIVQEFSDFARMPEPSFQPTDLNEVVAKAVRLFRPQLGKVKLVERLKPVPSISADPEQLHRMLLNLVGNALEALESKGTLTISLDASPARGKRQAETARITVEDDGPGMEEEVISKLFTPYFTTKPEGSGLGLVIAQRIVEQHKGRLNVTSAPDKGTKIEVHLPT
jgi:nitrogen fixation/metabolism regulation signal transduction histidine kinase